MAPKYCFDTSAFLEAAARHYPREVFPALWKHLETLIDKGEVISPDVVRDELSKKDDEVSSWAKKRKAMFVPLSEELQRLAAEVLKHFPRLVDTVKGRGQADAFVVALARLHACTLVTNEKAALGSDKRPRIPDACRHFDVKCINLLDLIREQGWKF